MMPGIQETLFSRIEAPSGKTAYTGIGALVLGALLIGCGEKDEIDKQMQALCARDGGARIYQTVMLPKDQFDKWGMPRGKNWDHNVLESTLDPAYHRSYSTTLIKRGDPLKGEAKMYRAVEKIYRETDGKVLGELVIYGRIGGDPYITLLLGAHPSGASCPPRSGSLISSIFIQGE